MFKQLIGIVLVFVVCGAVPAQESNNNNALIDFEFDKQNLTQFESFPEERIGFFTVRNKRFSVGGFAKVNWYKAQQLCAYSGQTLATISSIGDSETLKKLLLLSPIQLDDARFWLSGTELHEPGNWVWNSNGLPVTYSRWIPGKPGVWDAPCMMLNDDYETWGNLACNTKLHFICESRCAQDSYQAPLY